MKSFALAALVATTSAQVNFNCVNPTEGAWTETVLMSATVENAAITDAATCGSEGTTKIAALEGFADNDYCLHAAVQTAVEAVPADAAADPPVEEVVGKDASVTCAYFAIAKAEGDIRKSAPEADSLVYTAWAWGAGEALEDAVAAAEGDADSAKMITSALAAIATIAMVAY